MRIPGEIAALKKWAIESDFLIDLPNWQAKMEPGGQEHDVYEPDHDPLIFKLTKRNEFGLFPHFDQDDHSVGLRPASPIEYFDRLLMQNEWFEDDIRLEGIGQTDAGSIYTLTSQPFIQGRAATLEEIAELLSSLGFTELDRELAAWIAVSEKIILSDAHPRNVVIDAKGHVLPIDLIMGRY